MSFEDYIDGRSEAYSNANSASQGTKELPVGKYQGEIYEAKITQSRKDGEYYVRFGIKVFGPTHIGFKTSKLYSLAAPMPGKFDRIEMLKKDLFTIGVELDSLKKITGALDIIKGRKIDFEIWEKNEYLNVSIKKLISDEPEVDFQEEETPF
jgi:hypothetical protein